MADSFFSAKMLLCAKMAAREVVDSWEDIEEAEILETSLVPSDPPSPEDCDIVSRGVMNGPIIFQDDSYRSQYSSQEPTVKILKRPQKNINGSKHNVLMNGDSKPRQPVKTLQQREQEYAEARLRILGEARSPEEQINISTTDRISKIQSKMEVLRTCENANIIRLPKGPDGTRGFNIRR